MATRADLDRALARLTGAPGEPRFDAAREYLRLVRALRVRESPLVLEYGAALLRRQAGRLGTEERWLVAEQVCMAALDCRALPVARGLVRQISAAFGGSQRAARLEEMLAEAEGSYDEAERKIEAMLEETPDSEAMLKRQVALQKSKGNLGAAIDLLRRYVDTFQMDREAWEELGELYVQAQLYPQAAMCYEELLLHQPASAATYTQLADVLYTAGGPANLAAARAHYAAAIELSGGSNVRALYGACACAAQEKAKGPKGDAALADLAAQQLLALYGRHAPDKLPLVRGLLQAQGRPAPPS